MATNSRLNSVAFPEMRVVGEEGVVAVVGVTGGVAETTVETAEAVVGGEGADHPEIVECHRPVTEEAETMTVTPVMTTVVVDTVVLLRLAASLLPLVDFIQVPTMAMGTILLPLMVLKEVLMDPLLVDLAPLLLVEVAVVMVDLLVDLVPLEPAFLNLPILYLHRGRHQTVDLVAPEQTVVVPLVLPPEAWVPLLEKDIQVAPHLPAPLHLGEIWAMDDGLLIWGDLLLREMVPATIEVVLLAVVSF